MQQQYRPETDRLKNTKTLPPKSTKNPKYTKKPDTLSSEPTDACEINFGFDDDHEYFTSDIEDGGNEDIYDDYHVVHDEIPNCAGLDPDDEDYGGAQTYNDENVEDLWTAQEDIDNSMTAEQKL